MPSPVSIIDGARESGVVSMLTSALMSKMPMVINDVPAKRIQRGPIRSVNLPASGAVTMIITDIGVIDRPALIGE